MISPALRCRLFFGTCRFVTESFPIAGEWTLRATVAAIIPARYDSSRFAGKPLASLRRKPLVQWVYELAGRASRVNRVLVATDDERIAEAVKRFGGEAVMTSVNHSSGTDRLAEAAAGLDCDLVVNVQGDEPLLEPGDIDRAVSALERDSRASMASLFWRITDLREYADPNVVKVVIDRDGYALYFSRAPIPHDRDGGASGERREAGLKHIGLYVYRRDFLIRFASLTPSPLERCEKLEQLRALEWGYRIQMVEASRDTIGVDTREDLARVEEYLHRIENREREGERIS